MAKFRITSPNGEQFEITAPEGATQEQALAYAQEQFKAQTGGLNPSSPPQLKQAPLQRPVHPSAPERMPIGEVAGGITGNVVGAPAGPAASVALGGLIAGGGEAIQQLVEHATGSQFAPQTSEQAAKQIGTAAAYGTAADIGGRIVGKGLQKVLAPFRGTLLPEAESTIKFIEQRAPATPAGESVRKQPLLPAEATEARSLDIAENIAEYSLLGGNAIRNFKLNRQKVFEGMANDFADQFGPRMTPDDIGRAVMKAAEGGKAAAQAPARVLYNTIDEAVKPVTKTVRDVELTGLLDASGRPAYKTVARQVEESVAPVNIKPIKDELERMRKISLQAGGLEGTHAGDDLLNYVFSKPDAVDYQVAKEMRSRIRTLGDRIALENKKAPAIGKAERLEKNLTTQIRAALEEFDPAIREMWDEANTIYKQGEATFNNSLIKRLMRMGTEEGRGDPEGMMRVILQPGKSTTLERIKQAVDASTWEKIQGYAMRDLLAKSEDKAGTLVGTKLEQAAFGRTGLGEQMMEKLFGPQSSMYLRQLGKAIEIGQAKQAEGTGRMFIQLSQAGAIVNVAANVLGMADTGFEAESGAIILGPLMLGKLMTSPVGAKWLIQGVQTPLVSPLAGALSARALSILGPRPSRQEPTVTTQPAVEYGQPAMMPEVPKAFQLQP